MIMILAHTARRDSDDRKWRIRYCTVVLCDCVVIVYTYERGYYQYSKVTSTGRFWYLVHLVE